MNSTDKNFEIKWNAIGDDTFISHMPSMQFQQMLYLKKMQNAEIVENVIFLFHDFCHSSDAFLEFTKWILKEIKNCAVLTLDYVGHGQSSGTRGHFDKFEILVSDQLNFIQNAGTNVDQNIFYIGHGLGGVVTLDLYNKFLNVLNHRPKSLILTNFILNIDHPLLKQNFNKKILNFSLDHLRVIKFYEFKNLSHKAQWVRALGQDPLFVHRPTLKSIIELKAKAKTIYQDAYFLNLPVFIGWSENDPYISRSGMHYFIKGIKKNLLNEKTYSLMKHDLYNEIDSDTFYNDLKNWIIQHEN